MNRIKNSLVALARMLALIGIIAALTPGKTQGQSGSTQSKDVSVVNTPGVNVVNSPAVSARQDGDWSVKLAEGAGVGIDPARDKVKLDDSAREPVTVGPGKLTAQGLVGYHSDTYMVSEGRRLLVEHIYAAARPPYE